MSKARQLADLNATSLADLSDNSISGAFDVGSLTINGTEAIASDGALKPLFESAWISSSNGNNRFVAHGLGRRPYLVRIYLKYNSSTDNIGWLCVGDLGVFGNAGVDYVVGGAVDDTYIAFAIGEGGVAPDWGVTQSGWPADVNAMQNYINTYGNGGNSDFLDTPTESGGTWSAGYFKVFAW